MQRIILVYGVISGFIIIGSALLSMSLLDDGQTAHTSLEWLGYLIMLIAFSMIFVAIKQHRDRSLGGVIRFGRAALLGVGITAVASVVYVTCWELYLAVTDYAFLDQYVASYIEAKRAAGVSGAELEKLIEYMNTMQENYRNPPFRILMTLLEIFPVGLLVALVSAGILRNPRVLPAGPQ